MADLNKGCMAADLHACTLSCSACGGTFIFRAGEQELFGQRGWVPPKRCPMCREAERKLRSNEAARQEHQKRQREKAAAQKTFDARLQNWRIVSKDKIHPKNDHVLYMIGNGFDLMHGAWSSYGAFRDSIGKEHPLRYALEHFWTVQDIWADFEDALAHFNVKAMCSTSLVDDWLDMFGAYEQDAGTAARFLAAEAAANPILTVAAELPRRFRMWVESLSIGTEDRPLRSMFRNGKVLCFNYTEFVETLYGVAEENVCYIHGCRRKKKYCPKETLILGHMPGAQEESYDFARDSSLGTKNRYQLDLIDAVQEQVFRLVAESDGALTKHCGERISAHETFFADLHEIEEVIVIGHALAPADWDYFAEVAARIPAGEKPRWYFGCYDLRDLDHLERLLAKLGMEPSAVSVFRTDDIAVTPLEAKNAPVSARNGIAEKTRCTSGDGRWTVKTAGCSLRIVQREKQEADYATMFSSHVNHAFFVPSGQYLFVTICGADPGVFLFSRRDDQWNFVNELQGIPHQSVLNRRLRSVYLTAGEIIFVYHSRVRKYALADGSLVSNQPRRNAGSFSYEGEDISRLFPQMK